MSKALFNLKLLVVLVGLLFAVGIAFIGAKTHFGQKIQSKVYCMYVTTFKKDLLQTKNRLKQDVLIQVPSGATPLHVVEILKSNGVIADKDKDALLCFLLKNAKDLKAGYFIIEPESTYNTILESLNNPIPHTVQVTIYEGLRHDQIASILDNALKHKFSRFSKQEFNKLVKNPKRDMLQKFKFLPQNKPLEGFLFPDTYEFNRFTTTATDVLERMLGTFQTKAWPILQQNSYRYAQLGLKLTPYQKLIIASIVERETSEDPTERAMVADIILKRLSINMPLQTDATLLYPKKDWAYTLTYQDIHSDNAYNTYTRYGLPPTPICNPGLSAIQAVSNPRPNPYYYYLHDKQGNIHYAKTYYDHLANVRKYIQ